MSNEVAIYAASVDDRMRYAAALAKASLLPRAYQEQPANVLLALEYGAALGIAPMVAIQGIHVIEGKPSASAGLIGALVRKAGHRLRVTGNDTSARCEIIRADDPDFTFTSEWTIERARAAKLTGKSVWQQYPAAMLKARAITECARDACPEALSGVNYTAEELGDDSPAEAFPTTVEVVPPTDDGAASLAETPSESGAVAGSIPADSPAPSSDITDAVVVEETLPDALGSPASQAERVAAGRTLHEPSAQPTAAAFKALQAALSVYSRQAGIDRAEVLRRVAHTLGREVESTKDLDAAEVSLLLNRLPRWDAA